MFGERFFMCVCVCARAECVCVSVKHYACGCISVGAMCVLASKTQTERVSARVFVHDYTWISVSVFVVV